MGDISIMQVDDEASATKLEDIHNKPNHHIVTLFYRDGCPPCDAMKPEWKKACEQFRRQYKCKDADASERTVIANVDDKGIQYLNKVFHKIEGTPTIMYMSNKNNKHVMREYSGKNAKRTSAHFLKWLRASLGESIFAPKVQTGGCWSWLSGSGSGSKRRSNRKMKRRSSKNRNRGSTTRRRMGK